MSKKIMIVDDAPIIRLMLADILKESGYEVIAECSNGKDAIEKYQELQPDAVTMDIVMPEMDGIEALKNILQYDTKAKVIMVTAIEQRDSLMEAIRAGATDYIVKPFEVDRVLSAVEKATGQTGDSAA